MLYKHIYIKLIFLWKIIFFTKIMYYIGNDLVVCSGEKNFAFKNVVYHVYDERKNYLFIVRNGYVEVYNEILKSKDFCDEIKGYRGFVLMKYENSIYLYRRDGWEYIMKGNKFGCFCDGFYIINKDKLHVYKINLNSLNSDRTFYASEFAFSVFDDVKNFVCGFHYWFIIKTDNTVKTNFEQYNTKHRKIFIHDNNIFYFIKNEYSPEKSEIYRMDTCLCHDIKIICEFYFLKNGSLYFYKNNKFYVWTNCDLKETKQVVSFHPKANNPLSRKKIVLNVLLALNRLNIRIPVCLRKFVFVKFIYKF